MLYFNTLPKIITPDQNGNAILLTNILTRAKLLEELQNNPMLFYKYDIQDGDTPEIIADKYYDDVNRFWLVMYANQLLDPLWDWPLPYQQFLLYIDSKYKDAAEAENKTPFEYTNTTIHNYEKIIETLDSETQLTSKQTVSIDETTYNALTPSSETFLLPNGFFCTITITKSAVTIFDYEYNLNESRRNIKILNSTFASQMEDAFAKVMSK
jgi:hypothetical protein